MKTISLKCPNCHKQISINESDSLWTQLKKSVSSELEQIIEKQKKELLKKKEEFKFILSETVEATKMAAAKQSAESHKLELLQKDKLVNDLKKQVEVLKSKIEQNSPQLIGEVQELRLEQLLEETFGELGDKVVPIPKGVNGADCYLEVNSGPNTLGRILFESKSTQRFSKKWIEKLKEDNKNSVNAEVLVIVTRTMPKGYENESYVVMDGIFICRMDFVKTLSTFLRYSVCKIAQLKLKYDGKTDKQHLLFTYITSPEFENITKSCLGQLEKLKVAMDTEKKKLVKMYTLREQEISKTIASLMECFGSINGIVTSESVRKAS